MKIVKESLVETVSDVFAPKKLSAKKQKEWDKYAVLYDLCNKFQSDGFEVQEDIAENEDFSVTNKKNWMIYFKKWGDVLTASVPGYKGDIELGEVGFDYETLKELVNAINKKWIKENDPHGDQW